MKKDKNITRESLAAKCNVSVETIKRDVRTLKQLGRIKRIGADKTGYWHVIE
jgi:predicted HTH transcriptional regulator